MEASSIGAFAPAVVLFAALGNWSLISSLFLVTFLIVQYNTRRRGPRVRPKPVIWMSVVLLSTTVIVAEGITELVWAIVGSSWNISDSYVLKLLGLARSNPWPGSLGVILTLLPQFAVTLVAVCALYQEQQQFNAAEQLDWDEEDSNWRANLRNLLQPCFQVLAGIACPSWIALPYIVCSYAGLFMWSMTGSMSAHSWSWRPIQLYSGLHILLLYAYQLPISFPDSITDVGNYFGLFKASDKELGWPEGVQVVSLIALYILLCYAVNDEQESAVQGPVRGSLPRYYSGGTSPEEGRDDMADDSLSQRLLPTQGPASARETIPLSRRWDSGQRRVVVLQHATINFITYGFPVCLVALVCWSFIYASICAFGLLLYVGYIFYAFPSIHVLRKLNPILLGFILSWSLGTYIFNAAFTFISEQSQMRMEIWNSLGLWHYLEPGLFVFAQFALGLLIAIDIFVSNDFMQRMEETEASPLDEGGRLSEGKDWKVLVLAVIAWCLRRSAYVITLALIFVVGMKKGLLHAVYMGFFLVYLVSAAAAKRTRQLLILFCELHFATIYLLRLEWVSNFLNTHKDHLRPVLLQLGLWEKGTFRDFLGIMLLLCFLAVQNHGVKVLNSLSATIQQSPQCPLGWGILRVGSGRSVLLSVYASQNFGPLQQESSNDVNWVTNNLATMAESIRATYRSFGTYIAYGTVLTVIYFVEPSYASLGYLCLLLGWVIGRQIMGQTTSRLWYPLMIYAGGVFIFRYILTVIPALQDVTSEWFSLHDDFGYNSNSSLMGHLWDPLAILSAMQLYRFERRQVSVPAEVQDGYQDSSGSFSGLSGFVKRFIILHCGKLLTLTVFYSSVNPVSATGFLYLIMVIVTSNMSKSSKLPGQLYSVYTGILIVAEYLFQMLGDRAQMFPSQTHGQFAHWIGFRFYSEDFMGTERGLRSKVLVVVACIVQYCSLHWLDQLPPSLNTDDGNGEPCLLFLPYRHRSQISFDAYFEAVSAEERDGQRGPKISAQSSRQSPILRKASSEVSETPGQQKKKPKRPGVGLVDSPSSSVLFSSSEGNLTTTDLEEIPRRPTMGSPWGSSRESRRWTKRAGLLVKHEKYDAQLRSLSIYVKHIIENFCQLYGLELSMLSLLVASFVVLNVLSLFYMFILGLCVVLRRRTLRTLWPSFVILFALVLVTEYAVLGNGPPAWNLTSLHKSTIPCNQCSASSTDHPGRCWKCWLGLAVDDWQMVAAHFVVFFVTSLQLRANKGSGNQENRSLFSAVPPADRLAWKEMAFETSNQWTWFDHLRFFFYRHLLHVVLFLVFATGTLQYDVLHLGYLTFSLVLFRMRSTIMVKRNSIFRFLRLYNFILILSSLIYQAPYFGGLDSTQCAVIADVYNIVGLYKMKYGFRITARSAIVDITIFCLAGLQAHVFRSREFDQVQRYLESDQVGARAHAQEDKAAWKKEHLEHLRAMEEQKVQRHLQVEKMKTDMVHLQLRLDVLDSTGKFNEVISPMGIEMDDRGGGGGRNHPLSHPYPAPFPRLTGGQAAPHHGIDKMPSESNLQTSLIPKESTILVSPLSRPDGPPEGSYHAVRRRTVPEVPEEPSLQSKNNAASSSLITGETSTSEGTSSGVLRRTFSDSDIKVSAAPGGEGISTLPFLSPAGKRYSDLAENQRLKSSVQLLESGVAQVQNLGNKALANLVDPLVDLFNLDQVEQDPETSSTDDESHLDKQNPFQQKSSPVSYDNLQEEHAQSEKRRMRDTWRRVSILCHYFWSQLASNTEVTCYFFFVLVFTWNFSFLTLVYPAMLFLYVLLANPGPSQQFWFFMLVYTELNILLQYMYQIHVQTCDGQEVSVWLRKIGIPGASMSHSFVISVLPLFLVYLSTLVQSSIRARDGEWVFINERGRFPPSNHVLHAERQSYLARLKQHLWKVVKLAREAVHGVHKGLNRYWRALGSGSEAPPHFVQVSLHVGTWPEDGIQPGWMESQFNMLLELVQETGSSEERSARETVSRGKKAFSSRVCVESIEISPDNSGIALAVLEVIQTAPPEGYFVGGEHQTLTPAADVAAQLRRAMESGLVEEAGFAYPISSVISGGKREVDFYALIFGIDLICLIYVAFFYQTTVKHSEQLLDTSGDQFPKDFVYVLMTLFFLIMLDRVLYLCSLAKWKTIYYFFSLGLYTAYVMNFVWAMMLTSGDNSVQHVGSLLPLRGFYLLKAFSLALQAVQLKCGLPHKSSLFRQYLTTKISNTNRLGFVAYRVLPFLYELRCLLDWSCTTTSLSLYDWLKLEDIYASLFLVHCNNKLFREKHRIGDKQSIRIKFLMGILLFSILIGVIWAPMMIYSSGNPTNIVNGIFDVHTSVELRTTPTGGTFPLFQTSLCQVFSWESVSEACTSIKGFDEFQDQLSSSDMRDVQLICCERDAESLWMIPPPTLQSLSNFIGDDLMIQTQWDFTRQRPKGKETTTYNDYARDINATLIAQQLRGILNGSLSSLVFPNMYPRYLRVPGSGDVHVQSGTERHYVSGNLTLNREGSVWWSFLRLDTHHNRTCPCANGPMAITFSEEVPNGLIGETLSKFSIWSLYITFVLAVGRFIRLQCADIRMRIPFENFPACDRLLALCEDIYAARAEQELELEEGLFWTLIKIYRSPHILMEYTKKE